MTMHLYDLLQDLKINPAKEYKKIRSVFFKKNIKLIDKYNNTHILCSLQDIFDVWFSDFDMRKHFLSIDEMLQSFDLFDIDILLKVEIEDLILFSEILLTLFLQGDEIISYEMKKEAERGIYIIKSQIKIVCESLNYEIYEKNNYVYIAPRNIELDQAIYSIDDKDKDIALELLHYNNHNLQGDVKEKRKILNLLANYIEPILNSKILEQNNLKNLSSDVSFCLNKFNIRHNNADGNKPEQMYLDMEENGEVEQWYDKTYNLILTIIIVNKQMEYNKELKELKSKYNS